MEWDIGGPGDGEDNMSGTSPLCSTFLVFVVSFVLCLTLSMSSQYTEKRRIGKYRPKELDKHLPTQESEVGGSFKILLSCLMSGGNISQLNMMV